jgi:hypothetical protein
LKCTLGRVDFYYGSLSELLVEMQNTSIDMIEVSTDETTKKQNIPLSIKCLNFVKIYMYVDVF